MIKREWNQEREREGRKLREREEDWKKEGCRLKERDADWKRGKELRKGKKSSERKSDKEIKNNVREGNKKLWERESRNWMREKSIERGRKNQ